VVDINIEKALNYLRDNAKKLAGARADYEYLAQFRKSKKAMLMVEAEQKGITAANKQEVYAYSHADYIALLDGYKIAVGEYERLKHLQKAAELRIEVWRSKNASLRFEQKAYGN